MNLVAKTLFGLENLLAEELGTLGAADIKTANRAVLFSGNKELLYRVNYCSRIALSVLVIVDNFRIRTKEDLYSKASAIEWSDLMDADTSFSVMPVVNSSLFTHSGYPGLIVKDSVADYFRKKKGRRPSVNGENPDLLINLHISNDNVTISLDSSQVPLYKRGYRKEQGTAPLNEVLAAGILMLSGWDKTSPLFDPMCGSGTILVEAGLIANNIPPGKFRNFFGFTRWKGFDEELFMRVRQENDAKIIMGNARISGSDISELAVKNALTNLHSAELGGQISVEVKDFRDVQSTMKNGLLITNPPYGERLRPDDLDKLYSMIGTMLKHSFSGNKAWIITSGKEYLKNIGLKTMAKYTLYNGALECILAGYELYEGSRKPQKVMKSS
jgi:putative N6-adenine-specific DNA methylase